MVPIEWWKYHKWHTCPIFARWYIYVLSGNGQETLQGELTAAGEEKFLNGYRGTENEVSDVHPRGELPI